MPAVQSKYIPGWVSSLPSAAERSEFLLQQISPSTSERRLNQGAILFGRVEKVCDVVINHISASRVHAIVAFDGAGNLQLGDLGSTHGTFLDGDRLGKHEHRQLQFNNSTISFGLSPFKFKLIGTDPPKAQAAATPASTTGAASHTATAEQEQPSENGQPSLAHPASPPQTGSADHHHQQSQQQQQQHEVPGTTWQKSTAAAPAEKHIVGEELDDRASTAAFSLQHHGNAVPLTATDHSAARMHKPASTHTATDIVSEEQDPKASVPAPQPDTAVKPVQAPQQGSVNQRPAPDEVPMLHARGHEGAALVSQGSRSPHPQLDQGQVDAQQEVQEVDATRHGSSLCGHEHHAESVQEHSRGVSAEAVDVEDGEKPRAPSEVTSEAVEQAADAVVGEELHPKASSAVRPDSALRTSSRLASDSQHQVFHAGEELDLKTATPGFASSKKPKQAHHISSHERPAAAPVGEELDAAAHRHPKPHRGADDSTHVSDPTSSGHPAPHGCSHRPDPQPRVPARSKASGSNPDDSRSLDGEDAGLQQQSPDRLASGTHPHESSHDNQQQQKQQQQVSGAGGGSSHSSGSDLESHPASALPKPSWRQQEQQEPEEEAEEEAARADVRHRPQSRPFLRSGSQIHNSAQPGEQQVGVAGMRPHPGSSEARPHQSINSRGPRERSVAHAAAEGPPSAADPRADHRAGYRADHRVDHRADHRVNHRADHRATYRADHRVSHRSDHRVDLRADHRAQQPRPSVSSRGPDRAEWSQPSPEARDARGYQSYRAQPHPERCHPQDARDSRPSRHEADMASNPRHDGPCQHPPQHPRRPFTRDGSTSRPHAHADPAGHHQNRSMECGAEHMTHPRSAYQHMGPPDARDADLSLHGPAAPGRDPHGNHLTNGRQTRGYSKPPSGEEHMHMPDAERAQHGRSASQSRYADRGPGSRAWTDKPGYDSIEGRVGSRGDMAPLLGRPLVRGHQTSEPRPRSQQLEGHSEDYGRRQSSSRRSSPRDSRDPPSRHEGRSIGPRSSRDHRDSSGARRYCSHSRSRSRSTDRGSKRRRKESGFGGEPSTAPPNVAGDPSSAAAAVMRMQGHPTGTGLTLQQKKSKLWGSKAAPADVAQADGSYGSNRWDTAAFASATDKEKFSRLMGVKKAGGPAQGAPESEDRELFSKQRQDQVLGDLESQFITGLRRKDGRTVGLGL